MLNKFFHAVAQQPEVVNLCTDSKQSALKFSQMFAILFPHDGFNTEDNMVSWLEVFGNRFTFPQNYWKSSIVEKVRWNYFTEFILKYLSKTLNHIVFIFLGDINRCKDEFIDQNRHLTLSLCHPAKYSYEDNSHLRKDRDWRTMMPFINANFYRYQAGNKLVDWGDVNGLNSERKNVRLNQLRNLFEEAIELGDPTEGSCRRIDDDLNVVMNNEAEEYFTLKYWPT